MRKSGSHQRLAPACSYDEEAPAAQQRQAWVRSGTAPCLDPRCIPQSELQDLRGAMLCFALLAWAPHLGQPALC